MTTSIQSAMPPGLEPCGGPGLIEGTESDTGISNFGFTIDDGVEEKLRTGNFWTRYAGWNFNGRVWFSEAKFHCEPWVYGSPNSVISADTIEELMHAVSREYGYA